MSSNERRYRIALAQLPVSDADQRKNAKQIIRAIEWAGREQADFLITPESALTGHHNRFKKSLRDELMVSIREAVASAGIMSIVGACDKRRGRSYIEQVIIGPDGEVVGRRAKSVLASVDRSWATPGRKLEVFRHKGLAFGCLVCNDLWVVPLSGARADPRFSLRLAELGARAIFVSSYSGSDQRFTPMHESNVMLRAMEGRLFIAAVNAAVDGPVNAATGVMGPDGRWLKRCARRGKQLSVVDVEIPSSPAKLQALEETGFIYASLPKSS